jgi:hypothetical protein
MLFCTALFELVTKDVSTQDYFRPEDSEGEASPDMSGKLLIIAFLRLLGLETLAGLSS